jgi:hypothetical protein
LLPNGVCAARHSGGPRGKKPTFRRTARGKLRGIAKLAKIGVRSGKMAACGRPERTSNSEQGKKVPVRAIFCKSMFAFLRE